MAATDTQPTAPAPEPASAEPVLRLDNIQGNIVPGFSKDHQTLLLLAIDDAPAARAWLTALTPRIATASQVLAFNRLFKQLRDRQGSEPAIQATWVNVALTAQGLAKLGADPSTFDDEAFRDGLGSRSASLGDPADGAGSAAHWRFGAPGREPDVVVVIAGDDPDDVAAEVGRIEDEIFGGLPAPAGPVPSGVRVVYRQTGATLPPPLTGHEHFGFLDGVSQPGLRGRASSAADDFVTARQNPEDPGQGKPGQDLLWPGEFVFGYPTQDPGAADITVPGPVSSAGPGDWTDDGSYLVIRRLQQDVEAFDTFVAGEARRLGISKERLGAKIVGRWKSGAPIVLAPDGDDPVLAADPLRNNDFEFGEDDPKGFRCPFAGHIRKTYPRDDTDPSIPPLGEVTTQTHRLLRRGIPYGPAFSGPGDHTDRGLVFAAYQTSIVEQFEFVQQTWVNNPDFKAPDTGHDLIIGQADGERHLDLTIKRGGKTRHERVTTMANFVVPTGGGYFFAPSIAGLEHITTPEA